MDPDRDNHRQENLTGKGQNQNSEVAARALEPRPAG